MLPAVQDPVQVLVSAQVRFALKNFPNYWLTKVPDLPDLTTAHLLAYSPTAVNCSVFLQDVLSMSPLMTLSHFCRYLYSSVF